MGKATKDAQEAAEKVADRKAFGQRVKTIADQFTGGIAGIATATGIAKSTLGNWSRGEAEPTRDYLLAVARAANVRVEWLATGDGPMRGRVVQLQGSGTMFTVPVRIYDVRASAGRGRYPLDEQPEMMSFPTYLLQDTGAPPDDVFVIEAVGDSMEPTIRDADMLVVDQRAAAEARITDGLHVLRLGEDLLVKRLQRLPDGSIRVLSDNTRYSPYDLQPRDFDPDGGKRAAVIGRVIRVMGRRHTP